MNGAAAGPRPGSNSQVEMDPRDGVGTAGPPLRLNPPPIPRGMAIMATPSRHLES
jgi:hypothetical protein